MLRLNIARIAFHDSSSLVKLLKLNQHKGFRIVLPLNITPASKDLVQQLHEHRYTFIWLEMLLQIAPAAVVILPSPDSRLPVIIELETAPPEALAAVLLLAAPYFNDCSDGFFSFIVEANIFWDQLTNGLIKARCIPYAQRLLQLMYQAEEQLAEPNWKWGAKENAKSRKLIPDKTATKDIASPAA